MTKQNNDFAIIVVFFLVSLLVRILLLALDPLLLRDSCSYLLIANKWVESNNYAEAISGLTLFPPLPLYLTKESIKLGLGLEVGGRSITLFSGSLIPGLMYLFSKELLRKESIAVLCATILVFHPSLVLYSTQPIRESIYLFFCTIIMIAFVKYIKQIKKRYLIICGIVCSLGFLCRYESLEFIILGSGFIIGTSIYKKRLFRKAIFDLTLFLISFLTTTFYLISTTGSDYGFLVKIQEYF